MTKLLSRIFFHANTNFSIKVVTFCNLCNFFYTLSSFAELEQDSENTTFTNTYKMTSQHLS